MKRLLTLLAALAFFPGATSAQDVATLSLLCIGGHPDDCDFAAGGLAARSAASGHRVKFVALTNGNAGHRTEGGASLAARRKAEAMEAARRIGIAYEVLDISDGELLPSVELRKEIVRLIREWNTDVILSHRPSDMNVDHRYASLAVRDAIGLVNVPGFLPNVSPLQKEPLMLYFENPLILYFIETAQGPLSFSAGRERPAFRPDVAVAIDDVWEKKIDMLDAHVSQVYEFIPSMFGISGVPTTPVERRQWLEQKLSGPLPDPVREALFNWYGADAPQIQAAEAFEFSEYGGPPPAAERLRELLQIVP